MKKQEIKKINEKEKIDVLYFLPLILLIAIVPLIVYLKKVSLTGVRFDYWTGEKQNWDFFSYHKSMWLQILVSFSFILFVFRKKFLLTAVKFNFSIGEGLLKFNFSHNHIQNGTQISVNLFFLSFVFEMSDNKKILQKSFYYYPIMTYLEFVILSTFLSKYKQVSVYGFVDRYEGMLVLIGYMFIAIMAINLPKNKLLTNILFGGLFLSGMIISIIGIAQFTGHDFFQTAFGKRLILPADLHHLVDSLEFRFGKNISYSTLYNPNYVGSYTAMLFPMTLAMFILKKGRNWKISLALINLVFFGAWLASASRAGYVGGIISIVMMTILLINPIIKNWKYILIQIIGYGLIFIMLATSSEGALGREFYSLFYEAKNAVEENKEISTLKDIYINKDRNSLTLIDENDIKLNIVMKGSGVNFFDESNKKLTLKKEGEKLSFVDKKYEDYNLTNLQNNIFRLEYKSVILNLYFGTDGRIKMFNSKGKLKEIEDIPYVKALKGKEKVFSHRFYIWSRSIPMIKNTLLWGYGPDTYAIVFPQNDYFGKLITFGTVGKIVDKPHNLYLQIAINTGLMSLVALLIIFIKLIIDNIKRYLHKTEYDYEDIIKISSFLAVIGYLIAGLANDSVVSVAPIFWMLVGISAKKIER